MKQASGLRRPLVIVAFAITGTILLATGQGQGDPPQTPPGQPKMTVKNPRGHAKSAPLKSYVRPDRPGPDIEAPDVGQTSKAPGGGGGGGTGGGGNTDPVKQTVYPPATPPLTLASFTGITYTGSVPPDTNIAVGPTQVVEVVNSQYAVFDKSGSLLLGPANMFQMFVSMTGDDCSWRTGGDPVVLYDRLAGRWLVARYLFTPNILCVAVSQTTDATGAFNLYSYAFGPNTADYPKFGVWPDGYYFTANTFAANDGPFIGAQACAFDRYAMLQGLANAPVICYQGTTAWRSLLPSDLDSDLPPPAGAPNYFLQLESGALSLFKFRPDFSAPVNSSFTGPTTIPVAKFATSGSVPQPNVTTRLESLSGRLMYRLSYRNFGAYESLLATHTVQVQLNGSGSQSGIRWYEIRTPGGTPTVHQQSTYSPDSTTWRWMPSMAQDKFGNVLLGYSASSSTVYPSVRIAVRQMGDAPGRLQPELLVKAGLGSQTISPTSTSGRNRWGDYASVAVDPDGCTLWFSTEYLSATGPDVWATHLYSAKFSGCN
jgi:hypothetical protein